ncbi:PilZ domain-containing protein [Methylophilus medardicus]|uniref:PilZ domain-containing protein n=1 Tax=Methylophilus medardicus TaxID=2588534 RepID=A0A5B8CV91_9PROT|nr:PilZ domain-containing protein [Methylophilus medardicus]QDC44996.1 PilZ domain-containing protein [Methylophilus medardicus]QDC50003.1 PilZ domain-containing protein [Methylophilus medardicus]QDC53708.1 PilZ domain-containing protein [Methylophilus medardicus]
MSSSLSPHTPIDKNRRPWHKKSHLLDGAGGQHLAFTEDISLTGMSLYAERQYQPGQLCNIEVPVLVEQGLRHYRFNCRVIFSTLCGMRGFRTNLEFVDVPLENKTLIQSVLARSL